MGKLTLSVTGDYEFDVLAMSGEEREEGDFVVPVLRVTVRNPGVGSGIWGGSTVRYGTVTEDGHGTIWRGRMQGLPTDLGGNTVDLEFISVPEDEEDIIQSAANALRTGEVDYDPEEPNEDADAYDPLFYSAEDDDPATVLLARPEIWRWDRLTNTLSRTHLIDGATHHVLPAGTVGSLSVNYLNPPRKRSRLRVVADWMQSATGIQISPAASGVLATYTPEDFISTFPEPGTPVGDDTGWYVARSEVYIDHWHSILDEYPVAAETHLAGDEDATGILMLRKAEVYYSLTLGYSWEQPRQEILDVEMEGLMQAVLGDDRTESVDVVQLRELDIDPSTPQWVYEDPDTLERKLYEVDDEVIANGRRWVCVQEHLAHESFRSRTFLYWDDGDAVYDTFWESLPKGSPIAPSSARYFDTARGQRSVRHAVRRVKRVILQRARCMEVSCEVPWSVGRGISCADEATISHPKLGGSVRGKVSGVRLVVAGSRRSATITILVPVGTGGTPDFATNAYSMTGGGPVQNVIPSTLPNRMLRRYDLYNDGWSQQWELENLPGMDPVEMLSAMPTQIRLAVWPLQQDDTLVRRLKATATPMAIPSGINLEA